VVPRQYSTGGKQKLYGISKRGNIYLRRMLIHGARAVYLAQKRHRDAADRSPLLTRMATHFWQTTQRIRTNWFLNNARLPGIRKEPKKQKPPKNPAAVLACGESVFPRHIESIVPD